MVSLQPGADWGTRLEGGMAPSEVPLVQSIESSGEPAGDRPICQGNGSSGSHGTVRNPIHEHGSGAPHANVSESIQIGPNRSQWAPKDLTIISQSHELAKHVEQV